VKLVTVAKTELMVKTDLRVQLAVRVKLALPELQVTQVETERQGNLGFLVLQASKVRKDQWA
jgi:hypothetical protein